MPHYLVALEPSGWRPEAHLDTLQCTAQPPTRDYLSSNVTSAGLETPSLGAAFLKCSVGQSPGGFITHMPGPRPHGGNSSGLTHLLLFFPFMYVLHRASGQSFKHLGQE